MTMTRNEIEEILSRLASLERRCSTNERLLYVVLGVALGSGALQLSQVVI